MKRLKAAAVLALIWGTWFGGAGALLSLYQSIRIRRAGFDLAPDPAAYLIFFPCWGLLSGALFAAALAVAERNRAVDRLSWARVMIAGIGSAVALPGAIAALDGFRWPVNELIQVSTLAAGAGAAAAATTILLVRGTAVAEASDVAS